MEKFDLNEKTETTASDSSMPLIDGIFQGIETMMFSAFLVGIQGEQFKAWFERNDMKRIIKSHLDEYASLQRQQSDEAFEMHKLHMLLNVLEEFDIQAKWEGELWTVVLPESHEPYASQLRQQARNEAIQEAVDICYKMRDCNPANIAKTISKLKTP